MDNEIKIKQEDVFNNKELVLKLDRNVSLYLKDFQSKFVEFCKNTNNIQNEENFFKLKLPDQMKFNECIDETSTKVKKDLLDLENFYSNCKNVCYEKYDKFTIDSSIENYINSPFKVYTGVHPCIEECMEIYAEFTRRYHIYMIHGNNFNNKNLNFFYNNFR